MADKSALRKTAQIMFTEQGKSQKDIADALAVSEKTVSNWANPKEGLKWKDIRDAKINSYKNRVEDIKRVISNLTERRLQITEELKNAGSDKILIAILNREAVGIGDEVSKWTKALEKMDKDNSISLATYIEVMEDIFKHINLKNPKLYMQTLDFQQEHLLTVAEKLG